MINSLFTFYTCLFLVTLFSANLLASLLSRPGLTDKCDGPLVRPQSRQSKAGPSRAAIREPVTVHSVANTNSHGHFLPAAAICVLSWCCLLALQTKGDLLATVDNYVVTLTFILSSYS